MINGNLLRGQTPVIGIVGGTGPEATINLQLELFNAMRSFLEPVKDQDYYPVYIDNDPTIPDRSQAIISQEQEILTTYVKRIQRLERLGANVVILACNTAHAFMSHIQEKVNVLLINMVKMSIEYFVRTYPTVKKVGLLATLGTMRSKIFHEELLKYNVFVEEVDEEAQIKIHQAIYGIKAGFKYDSDLKHAPQRLYGVYKLFGEISEKDDLKSPFRLLQEVLEKMSSINLSHIILGCTELPLILKQPILQNQVLYNPLPAIARKTLQYCNQLGNHSFYKEAI